MGVMPELTCDGCEQFYRGTKYNKSFRVSKAMFCIQGKDRGRFIWWGHKPDRIPVWCPRGLHTTSMVAPQRKQEVQMLYSRDESWGKD